MDINLSPQEVTVHNHKAKSFSFCFLFCFVFFSGCGVGFKNSCLGWILFVRTRVLTPDPTVGRRDSTCWGVKANADAVFSLAWWTPPNEHPPSSNIGVLNKSPTASSRSRRSLAYADASQSPFPVCRFPLSFCGTCGSWILPECSTHHLEVLGFFDLPSFRCMLLKVLSGLMTSNDVIHRRTVVANELTSFPPRSQQHVLLPAGWVFRLHLPLQGDCSSTTEPLDLTWGLFWFWFHPNYLKSWIPDKGNGDVCVCVGLAIKTLFIHGENFVKTLWHFQQQQQQQQSSSLSSGRHRRAALFVRTVYPQRLKLSGLSRENVFCLCVFLKCALSVCVCPVAYCTPTCIMKSPTTSPGNQKHCNIWLTSSSASQSQSTVELVKRNVFLHFGTKMSQLERKGNMFDFHILYKHQQSQFLRHDCCSSSLNGPITHI